MGQSGPSFLHINSMGWQFRLFLLAFLLSASLVSCQEEGSGEEEAEAASGDGEEAAAEDGANGSGEEAAAAEGSGAAEEEGSGAAEEECEEEEASGDDIAGILAPSKCKNKGEEDLSGADALAEALGNTPPQECSSDEKLQGCLNEYHDRIATLEGLVMGDDSGGSLEDQITLVLVQKGVIDCENDTQCDDDKACMDSWKEPGKMRCEKVCERHDCTVRDSECVGVDHMPTCECKDGFKGNGSESCVPEGFTEEANGKAYKMFDASSSDKLNETYVDYAFNHCENLRARLPVLDSLETIEIIKGYLEEFNFTVLEQWDRSSRRVWLGLIYDRGSGLHWADGQRIVSYPDSSNLFVWESRKLLIQEASRADSNRHYGFYIDGDIAKLPGGGRKNAAILCELLPNASEPEPQQQQRGRGGGGNYGGYPDYYGSRSG